MQKKNDINHKFKELMKNKTLDQWGGDDE